MRLLHFPHHYHFENFENLRSYRLDIVSRQALISCQSTHHNHQCQHLLRCPIRQPGVLTQKSVILIESRLDAFDYQEIRVQCTQRRSLSFHMPDCRVPHMSFQISRSNQATKASADLAQFIVVAGNCQDDGRRVGILQRSYAVLNQLGTVQDVCGLLAYA